MALMASGPPDIAQQVPNDTGRLLMLYTAVAAGRSEPLTSTVDYSHCERGSSVDDYDPGPRAGGALTVS